MSHRQKNTEEKNLQILQFVDSTAMATFYQWYNRYGYPYEENIGKPELASSSLLGHIFLYHHCYDSIFLAIQRQAVLDGKMPLHQYEFKLRYIAVLSRFR